MLPHSSSFTSVSERCGRMLVHVHFRLVLALLLIGNGILLGLETLAQTRSLLSPEFSRVSDWVFLVLFSIEMVLRFGAQPKQFFTKAWDVFDLLIVLMSWWIVFGPAIPLLRSFRILRLIRLIELLPHLDSIVSALKRSIPGILNVGSLFFLLLYIFSVMATQIYGDHHPTYFGTLAHSSRTLFQLILGDNWGEIMHTVHKNQPYSPLFFVPFIFIMAFSILNLFVGLIVSSMEKAAEELKENQESKIAQAPNPKETIEDSLANLQRDVQSIQAHLKLFLALPPNSHSKKTPK
jgi:voltage-gated sodium channel